MLKLGQEETVLVFFLQELWFGRGSVLPCKGEAERGQQTVLTSLMSKGLFFSETLQVQKPETPTVPKEEQGERSQCLLGREVESPVMVKAGSL